MTNFYCVTLLLFKLIKENHVRMYKDNEDTIILILVQLNRILRVQRHSSSRSLNDWWLPTHEQLHLPVLKATENVVPGTGDRRSGNYAFRDGCRIGVLDAIQSQDKPNGSDVTFVF